MKLGRKSRRKSLPKLLVAHLCRQSLHHLSSTFNRTAVMKHMRLGLWVGITLLFAVVPLSATPTSVPLFNQCPHVGEALGCSYLLVFGPHGATTLLSDPNTKDVDDQEDILVGIQNNSGSYLSLSY